MSAENWRRNLVALWIAQTLTMVAFSFVFPFIPLYIQTLGVSSFEKAAQWAGVVGAAAALSLAVAQPIWGSMADRWGRKPMVVRSMVGGSITVMLMGLATAPEQLVVLRLIQGAVTGTVSACNALAATSAPRHRLGFAMGLMQVAIFAGTSLGPLVGGLMADLYGYRAAFYAAGVLMLVGASIVVGFVRENFTPPEKDVAHPGVWAESRSLLAMAVIPVLLSVIFLIQLGGTIVAPVLSLFISDLTGGSNAATYAGIVLAATGAVSAAAALAVGRLSDRLGHDRILPACLVGAALSYFPQALVQEVWQLLSLRMLLGVFLGGLMPTANALLATSVPPERRGAAFGLGAASTALANAAGPLSGAAIATHWGMRSVFLATGVLFTFACGWVTLGLRRCRLPASRRRAGVARPGSPPSPRRTLGQ